MEFRYDIVFSKPTSKKAKQKKLSEEDKDKDTGAGFLSSREGKSLNYSLNVKALKGSGNKQQK